MKEPRIMRPVFPEGYVDSPTALLSWEGVVQRLIGARNYWLCTVRPNGRPHVIPKWGVWVEGGFYFDGSPETRHARNVGGNPYVAVHLESGDTVVILEGQCVSLSKPGVELAEKIAREYGRKYAAQGYAPEPTQWDAGGLFAVTPRVVLAWTSFTDDPTKFVFELD
jgi:hypothetical protein